MSEGGVLVRLGLRICVAEVFLGVTMVVDAFEYRKYAAKICSGGEMEEGTWSACKPSMICTMYMHAGFVLAVQNSVFGT